MRVDDRVADGDGLLATLDAVARGAGTDCVRGRHLVDLTVAGGGCGTVQVLDDEFWVVLVFVHVSLGAFDGSLCG